MKPRIVAAVLSLFGCSSRQADEHLVAVIKGPTDVTAKPGEYYQQDPENRIIATLDGGAAYDVLEALPGSFTSARPRFFKIRLKSGAEGYVEDGYSDETMTYTAWPAEGVEWTGVRRSNVEIRKVFRPRTCRL